MFSMCYPDVQLFPNAYLGQLCNIMKICSFVHIILGIMMLFASFTDGFLTILTGIILYCASRSMFWCTALVYLLIGLMQFLSAIYFAGDLYSRALYEDTAISYVYIVPLLQLPLYLVSLYYCFLAYKEMKAIFIEGNVGSGYEPIQNPPPHQPQRRNFDGQGYRLS